MSKFTDFIKTIPEKIGLEPIEEERNYLEDVNQENEQQEEEVIFGDREERFERRRDRSDRVARTERMERTERPQRTERSSQTSAFGRTNSKVLQMPDTYRSEASPSMSMDIFNPKTYDEVSVAVDSLKAHKPVILNIDTVEIRLAQRMLDFASGAVYALGGDLYKVAKNIFVIAPSNVSVNVDAFKEEEEDYSERANKERYIN